MFNNGCLSDSKHESATRCHGDAERVAFAMSLTIELVVLSVVIGIDTVGYDGSMIGCAGRKEVE